MTGRFGPIALAAAMLLSSACDGIKNRGVDEGDETEAPPVPVETARLTRGDIYSVYSGTAPIEAFAEANVIAKVAGEIREILVEEGDAVTSGQVLARLDGDRLRFELMQKEANLRNAQREYQRNLDLKGKGLISAGDFEKLKYAMDSLEATYNLAKLELSYTEIRAPIDGVVAERFVKVGNTIEVGTPTFNVTQLEPLISYLHVPEREYRRIQPGQTTRIRVDALQGASFEGVVARVSPVVDAGTGTFKITIEVSDASGSLRPGMFGRIDIVWDMRADALQVPRSAIVDEGGASYVFVVEEETALRLAVRPGYADGGRVEILEGLDGEERIVIVGQATLKDGSKVTVINKNDNDAAAVRLGSSETE